MNEDKKMSNNEILHNFLNVFWLRPESALCRSIDVMVMDGIKFNKPSLDLGCGDGIFSFIRAGGAFDYSFDMFQSVGELEKYFDHVDIYNYFDKNLVNPVVIRKPSYKIDFALDHKENLLKKAATLNLYNKLICHDANFKLPFDNNTFKTIFSNIVYWLDDPQFIFHEIFRILVPKGRAILMLPNSTLKDYSFYYKLFVKTGDQNWKWLDKIDRGRMSENIKHAYDHETWATMFKEAGLNIATHSLHLSKTVIEVWDIGLRPIFPLLYKMATKLDYHDKMQIKKEWIDLFQDLLSPLCCKEWPTDQDYPPAFHCYVVEKP